MLTHLGTYVGICIRTYVAFNYNIKAVIPLSYTEHFYRYKSVASIKVNCDMQRYRSRNYNEDLHRFI